MASPAAVLSILVSANTAAAQAQLTALDDRLKKTQATGTSTGSAFQKAFGRTAATGVLVGLGAAMYGSVKVGMQFEKQMSSLGAVTSASAEDMKRMKEQALDFGKKTIFSANEVAQAQTELAKGGLKTKQILGGALPAALALASAGEMDLADAAKTTTNAMNLFGLSGRDAIKVADMMATAANTTTADVADFAMALTQGGSAAKQVGYDLNSTMVVLEALAQAGIKNSDAGTSMKTAFLQLVAPTAKQTALSDKLGISFINQAGAMKRPAAIAGMLNNKLGDMTKAQRAATLKVLAGTDGFRTLAALFDLGADNANKLAKANDKQGTAAQTAARKNDNLAGDIERVKGNLETLGIEIYQEANPALRAFAQAASVALGDTPADGKQTGFQKILTFVKEKFGPQLGSSLKGVFNINFLQAMAPTISGLGTQVNDFVNGDWKKAWDDAGDLAKNAVTSAFKVSGLKGALDPVVHQAKSIFDKLKGLGGSLGIKVGTPKISFGDILSKAKGVFDGIKQKFGGVIGIRISFPDIVAKAKALWDKVKGLIGRAISFVFKLPDLVGKAKAMWNKVKSALTPTISLHIDFPEPPGWLKDLLGTDSSGKGGVFGTGVGNNPFNASGTRNFPGGLSWVNERGPEAALLPNGAFGMLGNGKAGAQLTSLPRGTEIFTAAQTRSLVSGIPGFAGGTSGADTMMRMLDFGKREASKHFPYVFGGGHGGFSGPYDCSGFVSAILHAGGLLGSPLDTIGLKGWGKSGSTGGIVVGVRGGAGASGHTMMRVGHTYFESGGTAGGASIVSGWDGSFPTKRTAGTQYSLKGAAATAAAAKPMSAKQVFGNKYSKSELATLARFVGMKNPELMAAIAMAESKGNPTALGDTGIASGPSKGLWQILRTTAGNYNLPWDNLFDPVLNAKGAKKIYDDVGPTAWSAYKNGAYKKYLGGKVNQKKLKRLKGVGTKGRRGGGGRDFALPGIYQGPIDQYSRVADIAEDYAQRAESVGILPSGRDQMSYLKEELQALLDLRNAIIKAHLYLVSLVQQMNKKMAKMPRKTGAQKKAYQSALGWRNQINEKDADLLSQLEDLHGKGSPFDILHSPPALGYLGGRILDVQNAINGPGKDTSALDELTNGLKIDDAKRNAVISRQWPVFANFPFAGVFHSGGVVPGPMGREQMAVVRGGEHVVTAADAAAASGGQFFDIYIGGEKIAEHVEASIRNEVSMSRRRS